MEERVPMTRARFSPLVSTIRRCAVATALGALGACASVPPQQVPPAEAAVVMAAPPAPEPAALQIPADRKAQDQPVETSPEPTRAQELPRARLDPAIDGERGDLWARVRAGFSMPDLEHELVAKWEQYYAARPDYVTRMTARGSRYLFHIVEEVERRGMPTDLALLPFIESAFDPQALSVARAAGMWQFMPVTGRDFELKQNLFRDDRRDIVASTRAALDYLQMLHRQFGDWHLALAAYNWGQGNVAKALARNPRARTVRDLMALRIPVETRNYVPKFQAIKNIVGQPGVFGLALPPLENHPHFVGVTLERDIDVELAARLAGLEPDQFRQLNPQMNKPLILAAATPQILLPYDNANRFVRELGAHPGPLASWTAWVAPSTMSPRDVARRVGMDEASLREVNRIPAGMVVKAGSTLLVSRGAHMTADVAGDLADHGMMALAPQARAAGSTSFVVGRRGDTVGAVARRHGVTAAAVAAANGVGVSAVFPAGQRVVVPAAARKTGAGRPPSAARSAHGQGRPGQGRSAAPARTKVPAAPGRPTR
jgi:membrane-bound lytic murein transglycosylase D